MVVLIYVYIYTFLCCDFIHFVFLPQPIMESGCLLALAERLRDSQHVSGDVLSEASAALAVMASHGNRAM